MSIEVSIMQREKQVLNEIQKFGLYKLLFSQKVAFCFVILFITTCFMGFSAWAVCKHIIDSGTFGVCFGTFGGIMATIAGVYNIIHGQNDRAAMQINADANASATAANTTVVNVTAPTPPPATPAPDPNAIPDPATTDADLPPQGQL